MSKDFWALPRDTLIHNDAHAANALCSKSDDGKLLVTFVDWEAAGKGCKYDDMGTFLAANPLIQKEGEAAFLQVHT
jgi:thiamine kinase-like enzyme